MAEAKQLPKPDEIEDELKGSEAPLLEHLIELRKRLIYSVIAIVVIFIACFAFAQQLYNLLTLPFVWAAGGVIPQDAGDDLHERIQGGALGEINGPHLGQPGLQRGPKPVWRDGETPQRFPVEQLDHGGA